MGVTAMSHTLYEGQHWFTDEPDISVVAKHRISHSGALAGMTDCVKFCANRTAEASFNDDPTDLPCLGFLFVDKGEPNCLIFVEHNPTTEEKVEAVDKPGPVEKNEPVHERERSWQSELCDQLHMYLLALMGFGITMLYVGLSTLIAKTLSALGLSLPQIGHKHQDWEPVFVLVHFGFMLYGLYKNESPDAGFWEFGSCVLLALGWTWTFAAVVVFSWTAVKVFPEAVREMQRPRGRREEGEWVDVGASEKEDESNEEGVLVEDLGVEGQGK